MTGPRSSTEYRALIEAAKRETPSGASRARIWAGVSQVVTAPGGTGGAAAATASSKGVLLGTLLGGAVTIGMAAALVVVRPAGLDAAISPAPAAFAHSYSAPCPARAGVTLSGERASEDGATLGDGNAVASSGDAAWRASEPVRAGNGAHGDEASAALGDMGETDPSSWGANPARAGAAPGKAKTSGQVGASALGRVQNADALGREASLLAAARAALARGDARGALRAARAAASIPGHQLAPEELSVESQAMRALGRDAEADALTARLRARFPDSALAR